MSRRLAETGIVTEDDPPQGAIKMPSGSFDRYGLGAAEVADRLGIASSTLNAWLKADEQRPEAMQVFAFHRCRGRSRFWSEASFQKLDLAIHQESKNGVLSSRQASIESGSEADPDAEDALARVIGKSRFRPL
jgi:hypothetical protein